MCGLMPLGVLAMGVIEEVGIHHDHEPVPSQAGHEITAGRSGNGLGVQAR
jgi:hypothetical protein